jgi:hypothetical protein
MIRFPIGITVVVFFTVVNGWWGLALGLFIVAVFGCILPPYSHFKQTYNDVEDEMKWEKIEPARKGASVDPTRPDDHPLMLTHEVRRNHR